MTQSNNYQENIEIIKNVKSIMNDKDLMNLSNTWLHQVLKQNYVNNFTWLGRPIVQIPQDIYAMQELIWNVKPNLIIETGIAHGGSLIMSASMLALLDYCEGYSKDDPSGREVIGIDIEIRPHNRKAIEEHPMSNLIRLIEGSSINYNIIKQVEKTLDYHDKVMVFLDSNHTHKHVLSELEEYTPMVSKGSYCVVWDTGIEDSPEDSNNNRPWGKGNNPRTAVHEFLRTTDKFEIDNIIAYKLMVTASIDGFLKRVK